jgi:hypothetical protein
MDIRYSEYGMLKDLIAQETRYTRVYEGQVCNLDDPLLRGRVQLVSPALGWLTPDQAPWCDPEYVNGGIIVPELNAWVKLYFLSGDPSRPVYGQKLGHVADNKPTAYTDKTKKIIFQDEGSGAVISLDTVMATFDMYNKSVSLAKTFDDILGHLLSLITVGPPPVHTLDATTTANLTADKINLGLILKKGN